jgi:hypothetical protein
VKKYPLILKGEMVRAILDGRKTQTRLPIKPQPPKSFSKEFPGSDFGLSRAIADGIKMYSINQYDQLAKHPTDWELLGSVGVARDAGYPMRYRCPFGGVGDRLWVRETFTEAQKGGFLYKADGTNKQLGVWWGWKPSIHMPRRASRITLENINIRVEQIQDISEEDAIAEGIDELICPQCGCGDFISHGATIKTRCSSQGCGLDYLSAIEGFKQLWESIYPGSWDRNDWVWVNEFKRLERANNDN